MLTGRQFVVILLALIESFVLSAHYAVFMPFYPIVAKDKGNSSFQVGAFFAVGSCVGLIGSLFVGWLLKKGVPPKSLVIFGLLLSGIFLISHGFYDDFFSGSSDFFYANTVTRFAHSIGPVAATTAIYPIVSVEMGEKRGIYLPLLEAAYNMGLMIWPSIGAILYDHFGYMFPFVSVGVLALFMAVVLTLLLPNPEKPSSEDNNQAKIGFDKIDFGLTMILMNILLCYLIIGFNDITLSNELKDSFGLSQTKIGYCFAVATVSYGVFIFLWGFGCKSRAGQHLVLVIGLVVSLSGLFLMGPCRFVLLEPTLAVRLFGQALMGVGLAGLFTASMISGMHYMKHELLLPDDVATHGFFSGLIFFSLCLGYFIGHACIAGLLMDFFGYDFAVLAIMLIVIASVFVDSSRKLFRCARRKTGYKPIGEADDDITV